MGSRWRGEVAAARSLLRVYIVALLQGVPGATAFFGAASGCFYDLHDCAGLAASNSSAHPLTRAHEMPSAWQRLVIKLYSIQHTLPALLLLPFPISSLR